jgi:hypothetical protein
MSRVENGVILLVKHRWTKEIYTHGGHSHSPDLSVSSQYALEGACEIRHDLFSSILDAMSHVSHVFHDVVVMPENLREPRKSTDLK